MGSPVRFEVEYDQWWLFAQTMALCLQYIPESSSGPHACWDRYWQGAPHFLTSQGREVKRFLLDRAMRAATQNRGS